MQRESGKRQRTRAAAAYQAEFADAVLAWLDFADEHTALASQIAVGAAAQAVVVSSGRVGRTKTLSLEERAALAARAFIRHRFTDYEDRLIEIELVDGYDDVTDYRDVKQAAQRDVDAFLAEHRAGRRSSADPGLSG